MNIGKIFGRKEQNPIRIADKKVHQWKYTTCGYCSTGCSIEIGLDKEGKAVASRGTVSYTHLTLPTILLV